MPVKAAGDFNISSKLTVNEKTLAVVAVLLR